jgi:hypothetical protein
MFGFQVRIDATQRSKKGQPAQSTTGVASTSCHQLGPVCVMPSANVTSVSGSVHQKRRRKSTSSGFSPSSIDGISGSRAMPHLGHVPGPTCRTSGCMGHVYSRVSPATGAGRDTGCTYLAGSAENFCRQ